MARPPHKARRASCCAALAALAALIAVALAACANSPAPDPAGSIVIAPDPSAAVSPADLKQSGEIIRKRLDALGLYHGMDFSGDRLTFYLGSPDDAGRVTKLATQPGVLELFGWPEPLDAGAAVPAHDAPLLTDRDIQYASIGQATDADTYPVIITLTLDGKDALAKYSAAHVGEILVVAQDGIVLASPAITGPITGGRAVIQSDFDFTSAVLLADELNSGRLPIALHVLSASSPTAAP